MRIKQSECLSCGRPLNSTSCVDGSDAAPSPGDVTVCFYCGLVMIFTDDLSLRDLTRDEMLEAIDTLKEITSDPETARSLSRARTRLMQ
jgi:hypothetical protein